MSATIAEENIERYLKTSIYTYAGAYKELLAMLPDDIAAIGRLVCDQITHPSMYFTEPFTYLEDTYYGKFASYPKHRFKNEDELYITAAAMIAGIFYLDEAGFGQKKDVTKRLTVSCRQASILFSAILKAKGIPCRSRAGFMDFGNSGDSYTEHWVNEYWDFGKKRWVLADVDGYYEYEERYGYSQFDLPRRKFMTASEAWLGLRTHTLQKNLVVYSPNLLEGVCEYLLMDFHALMNNEIFYSYQPMYFRNGLQAFGETELCELDQLAKLLKDPDKNIGQIEQMWNTQEKLFVLTNHTQNVYHDMFGTDCGSEKKAGKPHQIETNRGGGNHKADMLVKLYNMPDSHDIEEKLSESGIKIKKALAPDRSRIIAFARTCAKQDYSDEVRAAFANDPVTCYIATREEEIIGFACYEATAKNFFGPMAVLEGERKRGIEKALLLKSLESMQELGYAYAMIGWPAKSAVEFYKKCVGAIMIDEK